MTNNKNNSVVAVYDSHEKAEKAVKKLTDANIPIKELSIIGRGYHTDEKAIGFYNMGDRMKVWGGNGAFWGAMWGLLAGGLFMTVPIVGPVVIVGSFAAMVLGAVEGAVVVGSASALAAALTSIGIPKNTVLQYEQAIKADGFVVLVQGTSEEVTHAREILKTSGSKHLDTHCYEDTKINENSTLKMKHAS
jgi:uncharacterized membrane protein